MNRKNASMKTNGNLEADVHRFQTNVFLFLLRVSLVNVAKSTGNFVFDHIY